MKTKVDVIAERCKTARTNAGLLQKQLAEKLGVTSGLVSQWEGGRIKKMNPKHVEVLAELAGVSVDWLSGKDVKHEMQTVLTKYELNILKELVDMQVEDARVDTAGVPHLRYEAKVWLYHLLVLRNKLDNL